MNLTGQRDQTMKNVTRIPVQADSLTLQAANFFDTLRQRGKHAALIVPDMYTAGMTRTALSLPDGCVFAATEPGARWMRGRAFEVYVIANESLCAAAVHRELPGEGEFIHLLAQRQATFPVAHIYAFTEAKARHQHRDCVSVVTRQVTPSVLGPS